MHANQKKPCVRHLKSIRNTRETDGIHLSLSHIERGETDYANPCKERFAC